MFRGTPAFIGAYQHADLNQYAIGNKKINAIFHVSESGATGETDFLTYMLEQVMRYGYWSWN